MNLASLLSLKQVVSKMHATEHWDAILELVDHLKEDECFPSEHTEEILATLKDREEKVSTGIGHGVAIPHAFSDRITRVVAVFGRSIEGINFESIDNSPVHFVVLFVVPKKEYHLHLRTLAAIAKMFASREVRENLLKATTSEEILEIFQQRYCHSNG